MLNNELMNNLAKELSESFDYPWEFMPEKGREDFRIKVRNIARAARSEALEAAAKICDIKSLLVYDNDFDAGYDHAVMQVSEEIRALLNV